MSTGDSCLGAWFKTRLVCVSHQVCVCVKCNARNHARGWAWFKITTVRVALRAGACVQNVQCNALCARNRMIAQNTTAKMAVSRNLSFEPCPRIFCAVLVKLLVQSEREDRFGEHFASLSDKSHVCLQIDRPLFFMRFFLHHFERRV